MSGPTNNTTVAEVITGFGYKLGPEVLNFECATIGLCFAACTAATS